jgi:hypothetical protein
MPIASLPGYFLTSVREAAPLHFVGGENAFAGGTCPNCAIPFCLYLTIDTSDRRLGLTGLPAARLPLVYCNRCRILDGDLVYRVTADSRIELLAYEEGPDPDAQNDWDEEFGSSLIPRQDVSLASITPRVQELLDILGRWYPPPGKKMTEEERGELKDLLQAYQCPAIARGYDDVLNQIGGRPFLNQGLWYPDCPVCVKEGRAETKMIVLANLQNDKVLGIKVAVMGGNYFTFFICMHCSVIHAEQRM